MDRSEKNCPLQAVLVLEKLPCQRSLYNCITPVADS